MTRTATFAATTLASLLAIASPVSAQECRLYRPALDGHGTSYRIARPEGREMCFTIGKSAGLSAGRITVLTVRPVLNASAHDIDVSVTSERSVTRGSATHHPADISTPEMLSGAQLFVNADDERHITVRVRPRHAKDYRLVVTAHEIEIPKVLFETAGEALLMIALSEIAEVIIGKEGAKIPLLDHRVQSAVFKSFFGAARGHSTEQIVGDVAIGLALKEMLAGQDVPRNARIAVAVFVMNAWRELSKGATARVEWGLPESDRDTSLPLPVPVN